MIGYLPTLKELDLAGETALYHGSWEPEGEHLRATGAIEFWVDRLSEIRPRVVYDIGANTGSFCFAAALAGAEVHAFEPDPRTAEVLRKNVVATGLNVHVHEVALGLANGTDCLKLAAPEHSGLSHIAESGAPIEVWALDDQDLPPAQMWKLDVEGYERNVLLGAYNVILETRPAILMEFWARKWTMRYGYAPADTLGVLRELGYEWFETVNDLDIWLGPSRGQLKSYMRVILEVT